MNESTHPITTFHTLRSWRALLISGLALFFALSSSAPALSQDQDVVNVSLLGLGPRAFVEVDGSTGEIVPGSATNVTQDNVSLGVRDDGIAIPGNICFRNLGFTPRHVQLTPEVWAGGMVLANYNANPGVDSGCPPDTDLLVAVRTKRELGEVSGRLSHGNVMVLFY